MYNYRLPRLPAYSLSYARFLAYRKSNYALRFLVDAEPPFFAFAKPTAKNPGTPPGSGGEGRGTGGGITPVVSPPGRAGY